MKAQLVGILTLAGMIGLAGVAHADESSTCTSSDLDACTSESTCEDVSGNWCNGACQEAECSSSSAPECPPFGGPCNSESSCENAGGNWCDGTCQYAECSDDTSDCKTKITGLTVSGTQEVDSTVTFTVNATNNCSAQLYYRFSVHPAYGTDGYDGLQWSSMTSTEYVSSNSIDYEFEKAGKYIAIVWVVEDPNNVNPTGIPLIGWSVEIDGAGEEPFFPF